MRISEQPTIPHGVLAITGNGFSGWRGENSLSAVNIARLKQTIVIDETRNLLTAV